jgi:hypothetical protein
MKIILALVSLIAIPVMSSQAATLGTKLAPKAVIRSMASAPKTRIAVPASAGPVAAGIRHIAIINDQRR